MKRKHESSGLLLGILLHKIAEGKIYLPIFHNIAVPILLVDPVCPIQKVPSLMIQIPICN